MVLANEKYEITITEAPHYSINSSDNKWYDKCINVCDGKGNTHYSSHEMVVLAYESGKEDSIILVSSYCTKILESSGILEDDTLLLILDDKIMKINLCDYSYTTDQISEAFGTYYEIFKCKRGFLVFGEIELILFDEKFNECWRYATQDILFGANSLQIEDDYIGFEDYEGNYHEVDWCGKQRKYVKYKAKVVTINMKSIKTPPQFQVALKQALSMPDFYGMNWDAYWDGITGLITLPDELILEGWHMYKEIQRADAETFEIIMQEYNTLGDWKHCECIYRFMSE